MREAYKLRRLRRLGWETCSRAKRPGPPSTETILVAGRDFASLDPDPEYLVLELEPNR